MRGDKMDLDPVNRPKVWAAMFLGLAAAVLLPAQESRGSIMGRITDPSGAAVPGAHVTVTNVETNTVFRSLSNNEGNYEVPYLLPGTYRVAVEAAGFKRSLREGILLRVSDRITLDFKLEVGDVAESVLVTAEAPLLETATASVGSVVEGRRAQEMPIAGGNAYHLVRFIPGAAATAGHAPGNPTQDLVQAVAVNGTRSGSNDATVDGVPNMYGNASTYTVPPQDMVEEFRVQTAAYDASIGHATGAVINLSTKSGTNNWHGTGYYLDSRLRAVPWFSNRWLYDPNTGPITEEKRRQANPGWCYQRWGATASGPFVVPRFYNGRNRTFWSYGYEAMQVKRQATYIGTFPTAAQRKGDFSQLLALGPIYQIYDPATIAPAPGGRFSRQPFPGNLIPASRIDRVAANIIPYWPEPNVPGLPDGRQNYFKIEDEKWKYRSMTGRIDHVFHDRHRMFFRASQSEFDQRVRSFPSEAVGYRNNPAGYRAALDDVYVFNPTLLLNLRYGLVRQTPRTVPLNQGFDILKLGLPASLLEEIRRKLDVAGLAFPLISVDAYSGLGYGGGSRTAYTYHTFGTTLTKMYGNHSLRAGGEFRLMRETGFSYGNVAPSFSFSTTWTRGPLDNSPAAPIGQGFASLLLGLPTGGTINNNASRAEQSTFSGFFLQDDWRLTTRLSLNLGLRYEVETPITERFNRSLRSFDFTTPNPIEPQARANYARAPIPEVPPEAFRTLGGLTFAGVGGEPRALWRTDKNNLAPRFGLAYQLRPTTVIRLGYGVFFDMLGSDRQSVNQGGFSQATNLVPSLDNGLSFRATLSNPFPDGIQDAPGASLGLRTYLGRSVSFFNSTPRHAYMQRWSLSVQRQFPGRVVADLTYVGNRGTKLGADTQFDPVPRQYLATSPERDQRTIDFLSAQVTNPFAGIADFAGTGLAAARVSRSQLLRPYPHFGGISTSLPAGYSYYHGLQVNVEKRLSHGLLLQAGWTWSKFMEATTYLNDTDPRPYKCVSDQDYTHRFVLSGLYELPLGRGRKVLGRAGRALDLLVGGWQIQFLYEGQSGQALGFGNAIFRGRLADIPLPVGQRKAERWFNVDAGFERNPARQLASNIRAFPLRFSGVRSDGINNLDASFMKRFRLSEKVSAQFRMEGINALNHVQFANPDTTPTSAAFGSITAEKGHGQRQINFVFKVVF